MKRHGFLILLSLIFALSCSKLDDGIDLSYKSTAVFYVDSSSIYRSDINGGNFKLIGNFKIPNQTSGLEGGISLMPGTGKIIFGRYASNKHYLCIMDSDGSNTKDILTFGTDSRALFFKGITGNKIYYGSYSTRFIAADYRVVNDDGSDDQSLNIQGSTKYFVEGESEASNQGKGFIVRSGTTTNGPITTIDFTFLAINNGVYVPADSKKVLSVSSSAITGNPLITNDGKKILWLARTAIDKYEVRAKDMNDANSAQQVLYTYQVPASGPGAILSPYVMEIGWADNEKKILIKCGSPTTVPYTYCTIIDALTGSSTNWTVSGVMFRALVN